MLCNRLQATLHRQKIFFIVVLILWIKSGGVKYSVQSCLCCLAPSNIALKNRVEYCLNTLGATLQSQKPCVLSKRLQANCTGKRSVHFRLNSITFLRHLFSTDCCCRQLCTNFPDTAQEESRANIEPKDKIVQNNLRVLSIITQNSFTISPARTN